jgi:SAM-dependent methyltransferase
VNASPYDAIAELYDPWSRSVVEDVGFYVAEARKSGGTVVELGIGTGRIAIPIAETGKRVIGVDSSREMLAACRRRAEEAGVAELVDLRLGDLRHPPLDETVPLVICPFRSYLHLADDGDRAEALAAAHEALVPGGRLIFDVFAPGDDDIAETHGRWLEREPGIFERADWDTRSRTLTLSVRGPDGETTMALAWLSPDEWRDLLERAGFEVEALYGWFDRRPFRGGEDQLWIARRA